MPDVHKALGFQRRVVGLRLFLSFLMVFCVALFLVLLVIRLMIGRGASPCNAAEFWRKEKKHLKRRTG